MEPNKSIYDTVPAAEEHYSSRSSTEVDESLIDEPQWHSVALGSKRQRRKRIAFISTLRSYRWLTDTILLLIIIALLVMLLLRTGDHGAHGYSLQVGGDYAGAGPICKCWLGGFGIP